MPQNPAPRLKIRQKIRWLSSDTETPISLYIQAVGNSCGILLESAEVDGRWGRFSVLAYDMCFFITCENGLLKLDIRDPRFEFLDEYQGLPFIDGMRKVMADIEIEAADKSLPPLTRALYGYFGFDMAAIFNPVLQKNIPVADARCALALPSSLLIFDHLYNRLCQLTLSEPGELVSEHYDYPDDNLDQHLIHMTPDEEGYKKCVAEIAKMLHEGEAIQVVPSVRFCLPFKGNPFTLYRRLRRFNASPYMFYMRLPDLTLFGSSPEVMVGCDHDALKLSPIAGTRRRGKTDQEDSELARELLNDPKERAEHVMLVDLGRNDLGRIAKRESVRVDKFMEVERFSHVMHITSHISATLDPKRDLDAMDVLAATFPAGTVSGAPKIRAMEIIHEIEESPRGPYAGCIGWIGLDKDSVNLDMGITIRSMWVKDGQLCWQAGGGIVHDSDPELEWKEVCNKSAIMRLALVGEDKDYVPVNR